MAMIRSASNAKQILRIASAATQSLAKRQTIASCGPRPANKLLDIAQLTENDLPPPIGAFCFDLFSK
jgi:hypothetical protein